MVLRQDDAQFLIHEPERVAAAFEAINAAALVTFGAWLQRVAPNVPASMRDNLGQIGVVAFKIGEARQQINAGLATNDVPDELVHAQQLWNMFAEWRSDGNINESMVALALDQLAGALTYLDQRTQETGTDHPRWNSRIVSGQPCKECGRM